MEENTRNQNQDDLQNQKKDTGEEQTTSNQQNQNSKENTAARAASIMSGAGNATDRAGSGSTNKAARTGTDLDGQAV